MRHDFGPVDGTEAAAPLGAPEILSKPDVVATDCGRTTFFAGFELGSLALLRHLGRRSARGRGRGPDAGARTRLATPAEVQAALQEQRR